MREQRRGDKEDLLVNHAVKTKLFPHIYIYVYK